MLTKLQLEVFEFIDAEIKRTGGTSPSFDEIKDHHRLKSKSGVSRILDGLEARGFIRREKRAKRAITILRRPGDDQIAASINFSNIPDDPVSINAEIEALQILIGARLTVLDTMSAAGAATGADAEPDVSRYGTLLRATAFNHATD